MEKVFSIYAERRTRLLAQLPAHSLLVLTNGTLKIRNNDTHYPFRPESNFYYLTGYTEPDAILVLFSDTQESILFNLPSDPEKAVWDGKRVGQTTALTQYQFDAAFALEKFDSLFEKYLATVECVYASADGMFEKGLMQYTGKREKAEPLIHEMRLIKDDQEIALMRQSAEIAAQAHRKLMQSVLPGMLESAVEALFTYECMQAGARFMAYPPIVAGGQQACTLHYIENQATLQAGDLVLIDAGAEYHYYASDITRTYPVSKTFNAAQRALYALVLKTQLAVIDLIKPGVLFDDLQTCAVAYITEGLLELGLLRGERQTLIKEKAYQRFYMHRVSHWLGLDVHDVGTYRYADSARVLEPGMVLTVEPGVYVSPDSDVAPKWLGIGIRIEDDVLVTQTGAEVLSRAVPKTIDEIEKLRCLS